MSAPEPTAVERTIADRMAAATSTLPSGPLAQDDVLEWIDEHASQAVVAAIRAMTPEQQAELIGGWVEKQGGYYCCPTHPTTLVTKRVIGPRREVQP